MTAARVLVVDDEESVAFTMGAILERDGYEVETTTSGEDALTLVRSRAYDLVLTDLRLNDMDGVVIVAEVQRHAPETQVILMTGYASLESAVKALREGAYDYLVKPCDVDELRATVARGVERRQLAAALRERVQELEQANVTISNLNASLQQRVEDATASLQVRMEELAAANEQLKQLDELKSRFLSMASHELKTPLTGVSGMVQIMARQLHRRVAEGRLPGLEDWRTQAETDLRRLDLVQEQTAKLNRLIDELLDVSRIEAGRISLQLADVDLALLAEDVVERLQPNQPKHPIQVTSTLPRGRTVSADPDRVEQVLGNLITNAVKYSPEGGPVSVRLQDEPGPVPAVRLSVRDRGIGIPPAQLESVFDLFYRSKEAESAASGMGLGLYICRQIVDLHGGRIWAESTPGEGSTFHVVLPVRQPTPLPDDPLLASA